MPSSGALKDLSFSQHFRMMVICIVLLQVLLQAVSVAVTYMYFTNEMKQGMLVKNLRIRVGPEDDL